MSRKKLKCERCGCRRITSGKDRRVNPRYCRTCENKVRRELVTSGYLEPEVKMHWMSDEIDDQESAKVQRGVRL